MLTRVSRCLLRIPRLFQCLHAAFCFLHICSTLEYVNMKSDARFDSGRVAALKRIERERDRGGEGERERAREDRGRVTDGGK